MLAVHLEGTIFTVQECARAMARRSSPARSDASRPTSSTLRRPRERLRVREARVALITGAGSGIGRATADALSSDGYAVALADISRAAAEETAAGVATAALPLPVDVADRAQVRRAVEETVRRGS